MKLSETKFKDFCKHVALEMVNFNVDFQEAFNLYAPYVCNYCTYIVERKSTLEFYCTECEAVRQLEEVHVCAEL